MPDSLRDRIAADVAAVGTNPGIDARLRAVGVVVRTGTPAQFAAAIEEQREKVREIVLTGKTVR
jgi:tripartite-type tricarboxylate transporter receptor subunit TctC